MRTARSTYPRRSALRLLAALGLVWFNMALSPCLMALETAGHDCPHCPPAEHCADQAAERCSYLDGIEADGRTQRTPDFSDFVFTLPPRLAPITPATVQSLAATDFFYATGPPGPPLYIDYCSYLN